MVSEGQTGWRAVSTRGEPRDATWAIKMQPVPLVVLVESMVKLPLDWAMASGAREVREVKSRERRRRRDMVRGERANECGSLGRESIRVCGQVSYQQKGENDPSEHRERYRVVRLVSMLRAGHFTSSKADVEGRPGPTNHLSPLLRLRHGVVSRKAALLTFQSEHHNTRPNEL